MKLDISAIRSSALDRNRFLDTYATLLVLCDRVEELDAALRRHHRCQTGAPDDARCGQCASCGILRIELGLADASDRSTVALKTSNGTKGDPCL